MTDAAPAFGLEFPLERTRARILRVNHSGECGAVAIYQAQRLFGWAWSDDLNAFLADAVAHEKTHRKCFREAMRDRNVSPCATRPLWVAGGFLLGLVSVLGGRRGVYACTAAIEQAVHGHLAEQAAYLTGRDDALAELIADILQEEIEHMREGEKGFDPDCAAAAGFTGMVRSATDALVWLATFGDSSRLRKSLRLQPPSGVARRIGP